MNESSQKISTGIEGLDILLDGGFPQNRAILVIGGPGGGKTILCTQFLKEGIEKFDENGLYVSLDYLKKSFMQDMMQFGWDFSSLEEQNSFFFLDCSAIRRSTNIKSIDEKLYSTEELALEDLVDLISLYVERINAKRVVIDDLTAFVFRYPDPIQRRYAILSLLESLSSLNVSVLIITEATVYDLSREINSEEYLSDGVVSMFMLKDGTRVIQISKMRGVKADNKPHPYTIVDKLGIQVFPNESIFENGEK